MAEEKSSRLDKTDKQLRDGNFTTTKLSKQHLKLFSEYCKEKHISKPDALHNIISFLHVSKMPLSVLKEKNDLYQMNILIRNYHNHTTAILKNFENDFLSKLEKNNTNNITFLHKTIITLLEFKTKENVISTQNFKLLRALVSGLIEDKDSAVLLKETLFAIQEIEKRKVATIDSNKEPFILEGIVGKNLNIERSKKGEKLYLLFNLAQKTEINTQAIWHSAVIWEGTFTQKLGLADEASIRNYFTKFKAGDKLKLKGYIKDDTYKDKDGNEIIKPTYVVTEVINHEPKIEVSNP